MLRNPKLNVLKKSWLYFSSVITVIFGIFLGLGAISDNLPKVAILYSNLFNKKVDFSMNSESDDAFMIRSTLDATYNIEKNFIKINTKDFAIQYKRKEGKPFLENIGFLRIGLAYYSNPPSSKWNVEIFSEEINIKKDILYDGSLMIQPKEFLIPIAKIKDLSKYWLVLEIGNLEENNTKASTVYAHSDRLIFSNIEILNKK